MALVGDLRDFALAEVLQILSMGKRTGEVRLQTTGEVGAAVGRVGLLRGRVMHAEAEGCEAGVEAFFSLMALPGGRFSFDGIDPAEADWPSTIDRTIEGLLIESAG